VSVQFDGCEFGADEYVFGSGRARWRSLGLLFAVTQMYNSPATYQAFANAAELKV
jgi:hypothetical protein